MTAIPVFGRASVMLCASRNSAHVLSVGTESVFIKFAS